MLVGARPEMTCLSVSKAPVHSGNHVPNVSIARTSGHSVMVRPAKYIARFGGYVH